MKYVALILLTLSLFLSSCDNTIGHPPSQGGDFIGTTFEFTGSFNRSNAYQLVFNFRQNGFIPYESDVILAYVLWESAGIDYWRPLPQTVYFNNGTSFQYNYDFSADIASNQIIDMSVFLDSYLDLSTLPPGYTQNQTFRVVVVPSDFLEASNVDVNSLESILNAEQLQLKELEIMH
ncbi:hypothetical protein KDU71_19620 [Carboxylicivirga sediminis]|uniref:Dihydrolipoamide dehydrogenase n=1 Tax=Carboxylicivirga sediminis TaxID=2006564 RepID=A0A941FA34_9BACT|nr:hypothetical protein [Carboxylicivirga sediminis]MBR8537790.1 hypothetical protein [Carboxylicivirga sediminis]